MITCLRCEGFAPPGLSCCPHCDAPLGGSAPQPSTAKRLATRVGQAAAAAATAITLMACYGAPGGEFIDYVPPTDINGACNLAEDLLLDDTFTDDNFSQGAGNAIEPSCSNTIGGSERIYRFEAAEEGTLHFEWTADSGVTVSARSVCAASAELLCEPLSTQGMIDIELGMGEELFLIVDGASQTSFDFTATFTPAP